jgi:DNA modification methylase
VAGLRLWEENPRGHTAEGVAALELSMLADPAMLRAKPLLSTPDGRVLWGNLRLLVAQKLGWELIPTQTVSGLTATQERTWALRDNQSYGYWDERALGEMLTGLANEGVDLILTGFMSADLDRYLAPFVAPVDPDEAPPLPAGKPRSRPGEIYELGPHLLACGDARDRDLLARLLPDKPARLLLTDPPYGVSYVGKTKRKLRIENDDGHGLAELLDQAFAAADSALAPSSPFYVASPTGPRGTIFRLALEPVGWRLHQELVWVKQSPVLGHSDYLLQHETFLYGWTAGAGRPGRGRHPGSRWGGDNRQTSVLFCDRPARSADHPTMKPVELLERLVRNSSRRGDIVLDSFAGSGSTLIACERLGRRCVAVELDPAYCDVIRRRYEEYTDAG